MKTGCVTFFGAHATYTNGCKFEDDLQSCIVDTGCDPIWRPPALMVCQKAGGQAAPLQASAERAVGDIYWLRSLEPLLMVWKSGFLRDQHSPINSPRGPITTSSHQQ